MRGRSRPGPDGGERAGDLEIVDPNSHESAGAGVLGHGEGAQRAGGYAGHNRAANAERGRQHGCGLGCEGKARLGEGVLERLSGAAAGLAEHQPSARQFTDGHPAGLRPSVTVLHNDFDGVVSDGDRPEAGGNDRGLDEPEVCGSLAYGLDDRAAVGGCEPTNQSP